MKKKLFFLLVVSCLGFSIAFACGSTDCAGGSTKCCTTAAGKTYNCPPPKVTPP